MKEAMTSRGLDLVLSLILVATVTVGAGIGSGVEGSTTGSAGTLGDSFRGCGERGIGTVFARRHGTPDCHSPFRTARANHLS